MRCLFARAVPHTVFARAVPHTVFARDVPHTVFDTANALRLARRKVTELSHSRHGFDPRPIHMGFVVEKLTL
jgi:hypothetical protein